MASSEPKSKCHRCLWLVKQINIEPCLLLFCVSIGMYMSVHTTFLYYKECVLLFSSTYGDDGIDHFCKTGIKDINHTADQQAVETEASHLSGYTQICSTFPGVIVSLVVGSWSDRHGRKPPLVFALTGCMFQLLCYTYSSWSIESSVAFILVASVFSCATMSIFLIAYACARDSSTPENLTIRIAILTAFTSFGTVVGSLIAGAMVDRYGFFYVFLLCQCGTAAAFLHAVFFMRETLKQTAPNLPPVLVTEDGCQVPTAKREEESTFQAGCDRIGINRVIWTLVQPRSAHKRLYLVIGLVALFITFGAEMGANAILPLFFKYKPLYWTDSTYSYYVSYTIALSTIGTPLGTFLLKNCFKFHETTIVVIAIWGTAAKFAMYAFCTETWQVAIASSISLISHLYFPSYRSFLASLVRSDETGRVFSLISGCENVAPLVATLVYNSTFPLTLDFFPGLMLVVTTVVLIFASLLMLYIYNSIRLQKFLMDDLDSLLVCNNSD